MSSHNWFVKEVNMLEEHFDDWKPVKPPVRAVCGKREYLIKAVTECYGLKVKVVPMDAAEGAPERVFLVGCEVDVPESRDLDDLRALVGRARAVRPHRTG